MFSKHCFHWSWTTQFRCRVTCTSWSKLSFTEPDMAGSMSLPQPREGPNLGYPWLNSSFITLIPIFPYSSVLGDAWTNPHSEIVLVSRVILWKPQLQCTLHLQTITRGFWDEAAVRDRAQGGDTNHGKATTDSLPSKVWIRDTPWLALVRPGQVFHLGWLQGSDILPSLKNCIEIGLLQFLKPVLCFRAAIRCSQSFSCQFNLLNDGLQLEWL